MTIEILYGTLHKIEYFLLVLIRISGFFIFAPVLGTQGIPVQVKAGIILALSIVIFPIVYNPHLSLPEDMIPITILLAKELGIGIIIGFFVNIIFIAFQMAGFYMGRNIGLAMANLIDPFSEIQVSVIGQVKFILVFMIFIALGGVEWLITTVYTCFMLIPLGKMYFSGSVVGFVVDKTAQMFLIAFMIASPILITLFITYMIMGFITRTMPQLNIFVIGFPIQLLTGLFLLTLLIPVIGSVFENIYLDTIQEVKTLIHLFSRGG